MTRTLTAALVTLGDPRTLSGGYLFHRRLAELAERHRARLSFVSFPQRPFPVASMDAPRVVAQVQRGGAEVLVLDSIAAAFLGPLLTVYRPGTPIVGMLHQPPGGIDHAPPRALVQAFLDRLAYRHAARLLVASESLAEDLRPSIGRPERIHVVPPGRDVASAPEQAPDDVRLGRRVALLSVGNWVERKGIMALLEAFAALPRDAATLHLVGRTDVDPGYERRVRARLRQPDLGARVVVHGALSTARVAAMYAACDAFVLPSLREPYGTVYGEAMAYGLPVVGWRAGNLPYLADDEREGLIVAVGDVPRLAEAMLRLAEDPSLRQRLGAAARRRAQARPTWDQVAALFFGHLREVLQ
ncbi:MAG: glycosyltransferase family 4 protein [Chloroflexota bacterium]|nr:glycosyltransferase family 4 protein [Chloroflexota bacterium]